MGYYTIIILLCISSTLIIQISISNSCTLVKREKTVFHLLFSCIATASFCEWLGVCLDGTGSTTRILHIVLKVIELSVAPCIAILITYAIEDKPPKAVWIAVLLHAVTECFSGAFGFIYAVDAESHYTHGQFYFIYVAAYLISIIFCVYIILRSVRKYQYTGVIYIAAVVLFMISGIVIQLLRSDLKVDYIVLTIASFLLYISTLEMIQQTDKLTELINRRGYENCISHLGEPCIIIFFDIDRFKEANDRYGHAFGDCCLREVGLSIKSIYSRHGKCFRFGGDEFCVLLTKDLEEVDGLNRRFSEALAEKRTSDNRLPFVSVGYSYFDPQNDSVLSKLEEADRKMYRDKEAHRSRPSEQ